MSGDHLRLAGGAVWLVLGVTACGCLPGSGPWAYVIPEQRTIDVRDPTQLAPATVPPVPPPETVSRPAPPVVPTELTLDQAIRIGLQNSTVVRVLAGLTAVSSGQTIYDPAISNVAIDEARATFDPILGIRNTFNRSEQPQAFLDPNSPVLAGIAGTRVDQYDFNLNLSKRTVTGGTLGLDVADTVSRFQPGLFPLNPQERSAATLSYTQPLLQGAGVAANLAPVVIARINTERSYFQLKDSVQELVRGVIEAYWAVVFARTDVWARRQQVAQSRAEYELVEARKRGGLASAGQLAQAQVALANFRAGLIVAEANLLDREAALRNILGLPPTEHERLTLTTPQMTVRVEPKWEEIVQLAEQRRPNIIELKLILEADEQQLILAQNQAQPRLDAVALYRWNGLEGETPTSARISTGGGQFTDWTLGVNFSVPLGLRRDRAALRRVELVIARDLANLEQGIHAMVHTLANNVRNVDQYYEQYQAFKQMREAARVNLDQQAVDFRNGRVIFLNVLQAITDWGNAVSAEAQSLAQYNVELANLERQTGTILETHGVRFMEETYQSLGPLGRHGKGRWYPHAVRPTPNADRYPAGTGPAERALEQDTPRNLLGTPPTGPDPALLDAPKPTSPETSPFRPRPLAPPSGPPAPDGLK